ncbi:MAG: hypothetical protein K1X57_11420 [Gemmataceae bacterium]|nr:hypothetical protein [Gemmataceae bacterium]
MNTDLTRRSILGLLAALPFAPHAIAGQGDWPGDNEWKMVPPGTNVVLVGDVRALYQSPIGQRLGWARRFSESQHAGLGSLPPTVDHVLIAGQFDYGTLQTQWLMGLIRSNWLITLGDVAKAEGSTIGSVADRSAVLSRRDAYFASVGDRLLAVFAPADRQAFARWLRTATAAGFPKSNEYLHAAAAADRKAHLVIAADLVDVVDPGPARDFLGNLPTARNNRLNAADLVRLFTSIRGFRLEVTATDNLNSKLTIDFANPVGNLGRHLPELIDDIMAASGAGLDDMKDWTGTAGDRSVTFEGKLSPGGLNHLLIMFELPGGPSQPPREPPAEGARASGVATLRYFRSLNDLLTELRGVRFMDNYERYAMWFDRYAGKIDQLPTDQVDSELASFGYHLAVKLRAIAGSLRGVPLRTNEIGEGAYAFISGGGGGWGRNRWGMVGGVQTNVPEARQQIAQVVRENKEARDQAWQKIDAEISRFRQELTRKYNLVF